MSWPCALDIFALAQDAPPPGGAPRSYSPYPEKTFPNRVYFGDTHLHTSYSTDAGMVGATIGPEEAYRFARGETVISSTGLPARLSRPLDFLVVSDHAENLGLAPAIAESDPDLLKNPWNRQDGARSREDGSGGRDQACNWMATKALNDPLKELRD